MPCTVTSQNDLPDYLKSIIKEIDIGDDDELKDCLCDLRTYVDTNSKRYTIPYCVYNVVDDQEIYNALSEFTPPLILTPVVDPQKLMELYFKYKSFDINLSATNGIKISCEEAGDDNPNGTAWSETVTAVKGSGEDEKSARLKQVCPPMHFLGQTKTMSRDCEEDPTDSAAGYASAGYGILLFFMQPYVEPECGQPGPVLYIALQFGEGANTGSFNGVTLNIFDFGTGWGGSSGGVSNPKTWTT